jgi:hypothetical protein
MLLEDEPDSGDESRAAFPTAQPNSHPRYKYDVFISYASADVEPVERLVNRLKQDRFRIWFDQEQMGGGDVVLSTLAEGLEGSAHVIVCLSEAYIKRGYTRLELNMTQSLDPSGVLNRIIPVIISPVSKIPLQLAGLVRKDLTNPERYETEYELLTRNIKRVQEDSPAPASNDLALEALRQACRAPFQRLDEPYVALFLVQRAVKALGMFLYRRETGKSPSDLTLDALTEKLNALGKLPPDIDLSLMVVRKFGSVVINDKAEEISITGETVKPGLEALKVLVRWTFREYFAYDASEVEKLWLEAGVAEPPPSPTVTSEPPSPPEEFRPQPVRVEDAPLPPPPPLSDFFLQFEIGVESQNAWSLAAKRVLIWEKQAGKLAVWGDSEVLWRDSSPLHLRRVATGPDSQLCVGSWEGQVRCFAEGMLAVAADLVGAVGDIQFCAGRWIVGTWKHSLMSITSDDGAMKLPPKVGNGVFRIAAMKDADWFAVADLRGGIALYKEWRRRVHMIQPFSAISSMAFAGRRLMVLAGDSLYGVGLDGEVGLPERLPTTEKASLVPSSSSDRCLLLSRQGASWEISSEGILFPYFNLPAGHSLLSHCHVPKRFTVSLPEQQGCTYWRDGKPQQIWTEATTAHLSSDGRFVTVVFPDKVQLYEDSR